MKKFEIGKEYFDHSICNYDCVFTIKIIKRTEKTVTFERNGKTRRAKLFSDERGEYIIPDRYSMAPVFRAECEVQPEEEPAAEESAPAPTEDAARSISFDIDQPADESAVVVMVGQRVECVCGACYPVQAGTVIGFESSPATRFFPVCRDSLGGPPGGPRTGPPVRYSPPRLAVCERLPAGCVRN